MKNYQMISTDKLFIDDLYQRDLSKQKVRRLMKDWNEDINMPILVSEREGGILYSVIDGQHRFNAMRGLGRCEVLCKVLKGKTIEEEAMIFTTVNKDRKAPTPVEMFKASLAAKSEIHLEIEKIVYKHGYDFPFVSPTLKEKRIRDVNNQIQAVGTLKRICERLSMGDEILDETLQLIRLVWGNDKEALTGQILSGVSRFLSSSKKIEYLDRDRLIEKLKRKAPFEIMREAKAYKIMSGGEMEQNVALAIMDIYNERLRIGKLQASDILQTDRIDYINRELA